MKTFELRLTETNELLATNVNIDMLVHLMAENKWDFSTVTVIELPE